MQTKGTWKPQNHDNYNNQNQTITSHWHNNQELIVSTRSLFFHLFLLMKMFLMFKSSFALYYCFCCVFLVRCPCSWTYSLCLTMFSVLRLVFCIIGLVVCSLALFLEPAFLCSWSCSVFLLFFVFVLGLYYSVYSLLLVLCPWSWRGSFLVPHAGHNAKLRPRFPSINHPIDVLVYCVCSLFLKLFFVVDVVRWSYSGLFFFVLCLEIVVWGCLLLFFVLVIGALSSVLARCFYCCVWFACVLCLGSCLCSKKSNEKQRARIWNKEQEQ